jgi:hypothetical protein
MSLRIADRGRRRSCPSRCSARLDGVDGVLRQCRAEVVASATLEIRHVEEEVKEEEDDPPAPTLTE